ncbi:MAG: FliM/FliN family flagellar motor switch protein [Acidimicrobiales bacterium]
MATVQAPADIRHYRVGVASFSDERLTEIQAQVARALGIESRGLSNLVRRDVRFDMGAVVPGPPDPTGLTAFAVTSPDHHALGQLLFSAGALLAISDLMMGGRGDVEDREPTDLETEIASGRMTALARALVGVVQGSDDPVELEPVGEDSLLLGDQVTIQFDLVTAGASHEMLFAAPIRRPLTTSDDLDLVARTCAEIPVELAVRFKPVQLSAKEVASLSTGDVVCLDHEVSDVIVATVDGRPLLATRIGRSRRHVAIEIVDLLGEPDDRPADLPGELDIVSGSDR